jgi:hypothetical protein
VPKPREPSQRRIYPDNNHHPRPDMRIPMQVP